jgi:hypothetical protein
MRLRKNLSFAYGQERKAQVKTEVDDVERKARAIQQKSTD